MKGRLKNTVIIMTSNVGAAGITAAHNPLGFSADESSEDYERMKQSVSDSLKATFRPEFLNRVDEIIIFNKLTDENIRKIASLMLEEVKKRINALGIEISFDDEVVAHLAKEGFEPCTEHVRFAVRSSEEWRTPSRRLFLRARSRKATA